MIARGIANSSPFIALSRIGRLDLLQHQFDELIVPSAVAKEVGDLPDFVRVIPILQQQLLPAFPPRLHKGEAEVILLGIEHPDSVLILDDWYARDFARLRNFVVIGTVGLILRAKRLNKISAAMPIIEELQNAGFRLSSEVLAEAARLSGERII